MVAWDVMRVRSSHIDQLLAAVPSTISTGQRQRLDAHVATVQRCEARIQRLQAELDGLFDLVDDLPLDTTDADMAAPNKALTVACELDTLERVQLRVDDLLKQYVAMLTIQPFVEAYGDG